MADRPNYIPLADRPHATYEQVVEIERDTIWRNPLDHDVVLDLHVGTKPSPVFNSEGKRIRPDLTWEERNGVHRYVIKAGHTRAIPKEFDKAIQDVRNGVIVGGLGPRLERVGDQERPKLHPSLDDGLAKHKALIEEATAALSEKKRQEEALLIAQAKLAEAEKQLAERQASAAKAAAETKAAAEASFEEPAAPARRGYKPQT